MFADWGRLITDTHSRIGYKNKGETIGNSYHIDLKGEIDCKFTGWYEYNEQFGLTINLDNFHKDSTTYRHFTASDCFYKEKPWI